MKVLVYGVGVIGSLMVHELCVSGNDVTVVARGEWKNVLESKGLCIKMHSGRKMSTDHPRVLSAYDGQAYDVTFSVMQNQQQDALLNTLAGVRTQYLVLVGNNMESGKMNRILQEKSPDRKTVLFGFQTSGGSRYKEYVEAVTFGVLSLTIGHLKEALSPGEQKFFRSLFSGSSMRLDFEDDMESWYRCHAAFIVPIACIAYTHHCNIRTCGWKEVKSYLQAGAEAYAFLQSIGTPIRPKGDDQNLHGVRGALMSLLMWIVCKTQLGELAVTNHCRHAVTEMQFMDEKFEDLRIQNPSFPMTEYDRLRKERPSWEKLHEEYDG